MKEYKKIKICYNHQDEEQTALIWTFAFNGAEYWCPYCGSSTGMLSGGDDIPQTKEIVERAKEYKKKSRIFLKSRTTLICSETLYGGKWISPRELPIKVREKLIEKVKSWKYKNPPLHRSEKETELKLCQNKL